MTKKPSLRKRTVARIPRKYRVARGATHLILGTFGVAGKAGRATWRGGRALGRRAGRDLSRTLYGRDGRPVAGRPFRRRSVYRCACGMETDHLADYNAHMITEHRGEKRAASGPTIVRRAGGKVIVRPASWAPVAGRHRRKPPSAAERAAKVVEQAKVLVFERKDRAMANTPPAQKIVNAFTEFGDTRLPPRVALTELFDFFAAFERAMHLAGDALEPLTRHMARGAEDGGLGLDPAIVKRFQRNVAGGLDDAGQAAHRLLADFEDVYGPHLRAVRKQPAPNVNLSA